MEDQTCPDKHARYLRFTCPTCKRRVRFREEDSAKLPKSFPFCSERCKLIDLGAWFDADYRIPSKPEEEGFASENASTDQTDSEPEQRSRP